MTDPDDRARGARRDRRLRRRRSRSAACTCGRRPRCVLPDGGVAPACVVFLQRPARARAAHRTRATTWSTLQGPTTRSPMTRTGQTIRGTRRHDRRTTSANERMPRQLEGAVMVFQPMTIAEISHTGAQVETPFSLQLDSLHEFRLSLGELLGRGQGPDRPLPRRRAAQRRHRLSIRHRVRRAVRARCGRRSPSSWTRCARRAGCRSSSTRKSRMMTETSGTGPTSRLPARASEPLKILPQSVLQSFGARVLTQAARSLTLDTHRYRDRGVAHPRAYASSSARGARLAERAVCARRSFRQRSPHPRCGCSLSWSSSAAAANGPAASGSSGTSSPSRWRSGSSAISAGPTTSWLPSGHPG